MRKFIVSLAATAVLTAGGVAGLQASVQASTHDSTFTSSPVSVTPNLGMVELILSGTGTVQGFGPATEVIGVVEDRTVSPCSTGGATDSAQRRIVMHGGVLVLHECYPPFVMGVPGRVSVTGVERGWVV